MGARGGCRERFGRQLLLTTRRRLLEIHNAEKAHR